MKERSAMYVAEPGEDFGCRVRLGPIYVLYAVVALVLAWWLIAVALG